MHRDIPNPEREKILELTRSSDSVFGEAYESRVIYGQIYKTFEPDGKMTEVEYRAGVLLLNGNITSCLKMMDKAYPILGDRRFPEKFARLDKLIAFSAQLNRSDEFDRFQHYARALIYQRMGDFLLLYQRHRTESELEGDKACLAFAAYTLALEHLNLVELAPVDALSSAAAFALLEIQSLLAHNIPKVKDGLRRTQKFRDEKNLGSRLLKTVMDGQEPEGNSFVKSDATYRQGKFNGVIAVDKNHLAAAMWRGVGKHDFLRRVVWLFLNDSFYSDSYYSFIDEWLNEKRLIDVFEGDDFRPSKIITKADVKMFLYGMTEWIRLKQSILNSTTTFVRNNFLYPYYHEMPPEPQVRFFHDLVKIPTGVIENPIDGVFLIRGIESLHFCRPHNFDRRIHNEIMMYVAKCMARKAIPDQKGYKILHCYADQLLKNLDEDPDCEKAKAANESAKHLNEDLMMFVELKAPSKEDDAKIHSNANFMMARFYSSTGDMSTAEEYGSKADESYNPGLESWLDELRDELCQAEYTELQLIDYFQPAYEEAQEKLERSKQVFRDAEPLGELFEENRRKRAEGDKERMQDIFEFQRSLDLEREMHNAKMRAALIRADRIAHQNAMNVLSRKQQFDANFNSSIKCMELLQQQRQLQQQQQQQQSLQQLQMLQMQSQQQQYQHFQFQQPQYQQQMQQQAQAQSKHQPQPKQQHPKHPPGPMKLEDDDEEYEVNRFDSVNVKQFIGSFGQNSSLHDNFDPLGRGPLVILYSAALKRHRLTFPESNAVNLLIGPNFVHTIARSRKSIVVDGEDYSTGTRREERLIICMASEAEAQRFSDAISRMVDNQEDQNQTTPPHGWGCLGCLDDEEQDRAFKILDDMANDECPHGWGCLGCLDDEEQDKALKILDDMANDECPHGWGCLGCLDDEEQEKVFKILDDLANADAA